ncbi:MAG: transposase [Saprospiraceae bacterium]|nr:transposase [Saprospiraceae bacterium]
MIESYGMEAVLVNPLFTKNMRNRKPSDLADSQWIYKLILQDCYHRVFKLGEDVEQLRTLARHRKQIIDDSSRCVNKMQKV